MDENSLDNEQQQRQQRQQRQQYIELDLIEPEQPLAADDNCTIIEEWRGEGSAAVPGPSGALAANLVVIPPPPSLLPINTSSIPHSQSAFLPSTTTNFSQTMGLIDGGTTNHLMRHDVLDQLQQQGVAPVMTPMQLGEMHIAFGRNENPEPVIGFIDTDFGKIYIVKTMSANTLIAEIEFTSRGGIIIKDDNKLLILINNKIALVGTRDDSNTPGSNDTLWMADITDLFKKPTMIQSLIPDPSQALADILAGTTPAMKSALTWVPSASNTVAFSRQLAASVPIPEPSVSFTTISLTRAAAAAMAIHTNSAKPRWTLAEERQARQMIWAVGGRAYALAHTLKARGLNGQPNIDPELINYLGDLHDDPAYLMSHSLHAHPGGSGISRYQPGEMAHLDIQGLWQKDKGVHTSLALNIIDDNSGLKKVYALDSKHSAADGLNLYRDYLASLGWQLKIASWDKASEVGADFRKRVSEHLINTMHLTTTAPHLEQPQRSLQGVQILKSPAEYYEKTLEAGWRSVKKDFACALTAQNNVNPADFWFWCLKDTAEGSNAFITNSYNTQSPYEIIHKEKPDADKVLKAPWGALVVVPHIHGLDTGLVRVMEPAFELAILMAKPLELPNIYFVLRAGKTIISEASDIRPLEIDELRLTAAGWKDRTVKFDEQGRIVSIPSSNTPLPTTANIIARHDAKRFATKETTTEQQMLTRAVWKGRIRKGGHITNQSKRQLAGRIHRSDVEPPLREHAMREMLLEDVTSGADAPHPVVIPPPLSPSDINPPPTHPLPEQPFTRDHPEVQSPKPFNKWFVGDDSGDMVLFDGKVSYFLPIASGRNKPLFRIEYSDGDYEDVTTSQLKLGQLLATRVAKERQQRQQHGQQLAPMLAQPSVQPLPEFPLDEDNQPIYWQAKPPVASSSSSSAAASPSTIMMSANVARAFIHTFDSKPTVRDAIRLQHLNNQAIVTSEDIKQPVHKITFESDEEETVSPAVQAFTQVYARPPTQSDHQWLLHLEILLERPPTAADITTAAHGPSALRQRIISSPPAQSSVAYAATTTYNDLNPSYSMAKESLDPGWKNLAQDWFKEAVRNGELTYVTVEEAKRQGIKIVRHLRLFKTKPDGRRKFRHTPDEQLTVEEQKKLGNLYGGGSTMNALKAQIGHAAFLNLALSSSDHINAYPSCNAWSDESNVRTQRVGTLMEPWETGLEFTVVAIYQTVTNGFCDAPRIWSAVHTRVVIGIGFYRSSMYRDMWYMFKPPAGALVMNVYVDDTLKTHTRNAEGEELHAKALAGFNAAGMPMKHRILDNSPDGIDFVGLHVTKFTNARGTGLSVTQPLMAAKLAAVLGELGAPSIKPVYNPHYKGWSEQASRDAPADGSPQLTHQFLRVVGSLNYLMATKQYHPMLSALSHQSPHPNSLDMRAVLHLAQHHCTTAKIPLNFYQEANASIKQPVPFNVDVDTGECSRVDGQGQCGIVARLGNRGSPSGAIYTSTKSIRQGHSGTAGEEAWSLWACLGFALVTRWVFEELAALHLDPYAAEFNDQTAPTSFGVRTDIGDNLLSGDDNLYGNATYNVVNRWMLNGLKRVANLVPTSITDRASFQPADIIRHQPTSVSTDSLIMTEIVLKGTETDRLKAIRPMLRFVRPVWEAIKDNLIAVFPQSREDNVSDQLTHFPAGPLTVARNMGGIMGWSEEFQEYHDTVSALFSKTSHNNNNPADEEQDSAGPEMVPTIPSQPPHHTHTTDSHANVTTRAAGVYQPGQYDPDPICVAEAQQGAKGTGVYATQFIPAGTLIIEYGDGTCTQAEKDRRDAIKPSDKWYEVVGGPDPLFIDGQDCMAANINHECGDQKECPANVQLFRDKKTNQVWVQAIKDIPAPVGSKRTFLGLDYNFAEEERFMRHPAQEWWREYDCKNCHKSNRCVRATPMVFVPP